MDQQVFSPTYTNKEKGLLNLVMSDILLPSNISAEYQAIVQIKPCGWGGNHRHPRREAFVVFGQDVYIIWRDHDGQKHEAPMTTDRGQLVLTTVDSQTPHMIENRSQRIPATILEFADQPASLEATTSLHGEESLR